MAVSRCCVRIGMFVDELLGRCYRCCRCCSHRCYQHCCCCCHPERADSEPNVYVLVQQAPGGAETDVLTVREVDMCLTLNGSDHHTDRYELMTRKVNPQLVIRRGQPFQLDLVLSRAYNPATDAISFVFTLSETDKPSYGHGTLIAVPLLAKGAQDGDTWSAVLQRSSENVVSVNITTPANCIVGVWKMDIDTKLKDDGAVSYSHRTKIYVLFNAWCKKDQVYMKEEERRREFVEMDTGLIWRGSYNRMRPCIWNYAQFEKDVLDCSLFLVTKTGRVPLPSCSDPVKITRALSAAVNSPDDNGALMGNWSAEFDGGTPPTKWVGSLMILQRFYTNKKPVKYGQCWVFAGVLTTVCRALGIPARTVTTYASAHDTQNSLTVDYFVDDKGGVMEELTSDSIWNFHVWNEVWMKRPDLEPGDYDGWNAIDATPQEMSEDVFRCGPTSVKAVKRGEVLKPYDSAFVYAEVNADKVFWKYTGPTQPLKLLRKDTLGIGQHISTKTVGQWSREDITQTYKYPEKSQDERTAMLKALKQSESLFSRYYLNEEFNDIKFDFKLLDDIVIGSPFSARVVLSNKSKDKDYKVTVILRVDTVLYTGKVEDSVRKEKFDVVVKKRSEEEVKIDVSYEEYYNKLVDQCAFNIACLATVQDTNYEYFAQDDFRVRKPDVKFKIEGVPSEGQEFTATASVMNPLPVSLKRCRFVIEGPSLETPIKIKLEHEVEPNSEAKVKFNARPKFPGRTTIAAKFYSNELGDVDGFIVFKVGDKAPGDTNGLSNNISS
ncbi:annulin-like isoform X2 [Homalodisca vitripennis]|uniref:annulin-like isoform X2 n=1 Tax=Homalodisca vitripennis TaxID=197043 RepID=UPI001EEC8B3C|nr:annulin-like isoform X2 [Homalodisca vitripennis]